MLGMGDVCSVVLPSWSYFTALIQFSMSLS